jgi:hypothetical protein
MYKTLIFASVAAMLATAALARTFAHHYDPETGLALQGRMPEPGAMFYTAPGERRQQIAIRQGLGERADFQRDQSRPGVQAREGRQCIEIRSIQGPVALCSPLVIGVGF